MTNEEKKSKQKGELEKKKTWQDTKQTNKRTRRIIMCVELEIKVAILISEMIYCVERIRETIPLFDSKILYFFFFILWIHQIYFRFFLLQIKVLLNFFFHIILNFLTTSSHSFSDKFFTLLCNKKKMIWNLLFSIQDFSAISGIILFYLNLIFKFKSVECDDKKRNYKKYKINLCCCF